MNDQVSGLLVAVDALGQTIALLQQSIAALRQENEILQRQVAATAQTPGPAS